MTNDEIFYNLILDYPGNLMSKNAKNDVLTKHIPDSEAIEKFFEKYGTVESLLDIGSGGGFPAVPIAYSYPDLSVTAVDSVNKKINFLKSVKEVMNLQNFHPVCARIEQKNELSGKKFDIITSRALAKTELLIKYAAPYLKKGGYAVFYKALTADEETAEARKILPKYNMKFVENIDYKLDFDENITRCLVVFQKIA